MSRRNSDDLTRFGIYKNSKRQQLYYDKRTKQAYLIQDSDVRKIQALSNRVFLAFALGILAFGILNVNIYISAALVVVALVGLEYYFRKVLIGSFVPTKNTEGVVVKTLKESLMEMSKNALMVRTIVYFGCGIGIIVLTIFTDQDIFSKATLWAFGGYAIFIAVMNAKAYLAKGKE